MITGRRVSAAPALALCLLTIVLAGCGTVTSSPPSSGAASAPPGRQPIILVVRLGAAFSPDAVHLGAGQKFQLEVSKTVQAIIGGVPAHCTSGSVTRIAGGMLSAQCSTGSSYLYTAEHSGSTVVTASVRPRCSAGSLCAQWVTAPKLTITVT